MSLTMPTRRGFLAGIIAAAVAPVIVRAESLMAVKPLLILPAAEPLIIEPLLGGNTLLTPEMITREALRILHQKISVIASVNRDYDESFALTGAAIGSLLKIRMPLGYAA